MALVDAVDRPLPRATASGENALADLNRHGYCIVADALGSAQVAALRRRVIEQGGGEDAAGKAGCALVFDGVSRR